LALLHDAYLVELAAGEPSAASAREAAS